MGANIETNTAGTQPSSSTDIRLLAGDVLPALARVTGDTFAVRLGRTRELVAARAPVIYGAVARVGSIVVVADMLVGLETGWRLIEFEEPAVAYAERLRSVAVRVCVFRRSGVDIRRAEMIESAAAGNRNSRSGRRIRTNVTNDVKRILPTIAPYLAQRWADLLPDAEMGTGTDCLQYF